MLSAGPVNFVIVSKGDIETLRKKDGGTYQKQNVTLQVPSTGEKIGVQLFPKFVAFLKEGGMVKGSHGDKYPEWSFVDANMQPVQKETNYQQVKNETAATDRLEERERQDKVKQVMISLAGLTQAYIIAGKEDPLKEAVVMRDLIIKQAILLVK